MKIIPGHRAAREAVGVFIRLEDFQDAIDELLSSGFHRAELSLLASERAVQEKLGHRYKKVNELRDDPRVPRSSAHRPGSTWPHRWRARRLIANYLGWELTKSPLDSLPESAYSPKADIATAPLNVRSVPKADICQQ
jgi:hypothetical protein